MRTSSHDNVTKVPYVSCRVTGGNDQKILASRGGTSGAGGAGGTSGGSGGTFGGTSGTSKRKTCTAHCCQHCALRAEAERA